MITAPSPTYNPKTLESHILTFWNKQDIFQKSIDQRKNCTPYIFLEGPPTANGMPHPGHILTRVVKDLVLRYQTMHDHYILRKAGWDTHGLPVEIEVEKKLGLNDKTDVENYGIDKFNDECKKSVFSYESAWVKISERIGFWLDMDHPYITLKNDYIESIWWSLKQAWEKKLLYKGHKVVPYCPRCGTALSAHEVAQGYKTVEDPSIYVKFKLKDEDAYFLAWTTTPWTLISNVALAVHPDKLYIKIRFHDEVMILAEERASVLLKDQQYEVIDGFKGSELKGRAYEPLFSFVTPEKKAWYVITADFVTMEDGTGIVHIAPAFGEDDYNVGLENDLPVVQLVNLDGTFKDEVTPWKGEFVKDADPKIILYLEENGLMEGVKTYEHEYPYCWRCDSPLLYYAMESWFIAMSKVQKELMENNDQINWFPLHLKDGRFGSFLRDVKDWALSRDRYWGTPLPIWHCENKKCGYEICIGSVDELRKISTNFTKDYDLHKPFVDHLIIPCPKCSGTMIRESEVIDCWYDSGSAFFAQWHYPFEHKDDFPQNYPVDFISEALDQTRGWFYSLHAISTFLFNKPCYKNVLTLGLVLDENNQKMSKSKKNYLDPDLILDREGADALRWYLFSANAPWNSTRFYEEAVKETLARFLLTLWNSYNFFATYASLDKFHPTKDIIPISDRSWLDRWVLSRFHQVLRQVEFHMTLFEIHKASRLIEQFLINDISNWHLRRSRKRLWIEEKTTDKLAAYSTMYEIFLDLMKVIAPFTPFVAEEIYQNLKTEDMKESIHLCDYPPVQKELINDDLEAGMEQIRNLVEVGRALRSKIGIKVRYPLAKAVLICSKDLEKSIMDIVDLLQEELNVKEVEFHRSSDAFMDKEVKPNFSVIGPKFKEKAGMITKQLETIDKHKLYEILKKNKSYSIRIDDEQVDLTIDDFEVFEKEKRDIARAETNNIILLLTTVLTDELRAEGFSREIIRRIQSMRKELDLQVEQEIYTTIHMEKKTKTMLETWIPFVKEETRSKIMKITDEVKGDLIKTWKIDNMDIRIGIALSS
jgi:isoleucyl-tRNA synthetase